MLHRLRVITKNQKGLVLIELLVAIAISGIIAGGITAAIYQTWNVNALSTSRMIAVKQVEDAIHWISRDAQMAQIVQTSGVSGFPLNLSWIDWENTTKQVSYTLEGNTMRRTFSVNGSEVGQIVIAEHINPDVRITNCQFLGGVLTIELTASVNGTRQANETRICDIIPRPVA